MTKFNTDEVRSDLFHKIHSDKVRSNLFDKIQYRRNTVQLIWQNLIPTKYAQTYLTKFNTDEVRSKLIWQNSIPTKYGPTYLNKIQYWHKYGQTYLTKFNTDEVCTPTYLTKIIWQNSSDEVQSNLFDKIQYRLSTVQLTSQNSILAKYGPTYLTKFNTVRSTLKLIWQNSIPTKYGQTYWTKFNTDEVHSNLFDKIQWSRQNLKYGPTYLTKFNTDKVRSKLILQNSLR